MGEVLVRPAPGGGPSARERIEAVLNRAARDPAWYIDHQTALGELLARCERGERCRALEDERQRLIDLGLLGREPDGAYRLEPVREGPEPPEDRLTRYERNRLEWLHVVALESVVYPEFLEVPRTAREARDLSGPQSGERAVYRYDDEGRRTEVVRYRGAERETVRLE